MFRPETRPEDRLDPLAAFLDGARTPDRRPVPLVATRLQADLAAGLAVVSMTRLFRNMEDGPIEATITLPVPVDAALFELTARVGERVLAGRAEPKARARETYEDAIERGKPAVLHEELLPGIHMLSVANIAPGAEIEATIRFAIPMQAAGGDWRLRVPLTVGDVYGRSPLPASDDLAHAPSAATADLLVRGEGRAELVGGTLEDGRAAVPLSAPVDLVVRDMPARPIATRLAGERITVSLAPAAAGAGDLDLAVLVDVSSSMETPFAAVGPAMSKYQAAVLGLLKAAESLTPRDRVALFEFAHAAHVVGHSGPQPGEDGRAPSLQALVLELSRPHGGTEVGGAIATAMATSPARDILLLTDGKSHALDVAALAASGRRFHVVLIGEDSLDAHLGRLAIATGGRLHVPVAGDVADTITRALDGIRAMEPDSADAARLLAHRGTTRIEVRRAGDDAAGSGGSSASAAAGADQASAVDPADILARGAAALAATLRLPHLAPDEAARLSAEAGLANHLTSLVLVDEAADASDAIPAQRKVPLATPRMALLQRMTLPGAAASVELRMSSSVLPGPVASSERPRINSRMSEARGYFRPAADHGPGPDSLAAIPDAIDYGLDPDGLAGGDLSLLEPRVAQAIKAAAATLPVQHLADAVGLDPVRLVIALLALAARRDRRAADRISRAILGGPPSPEVLDLARALGLDPARRRTGWLRS